MEMLEGGNVLPGLRVRVGRLLPEGWQSGNDPVT
jgi:hypothetical protein